MRNLCCRLLFYQNLPINRLLTSVFVLVNGIVFSSSNGLIIQCLIACLMNKNNKVLQEITDFKNLM